MDNDSDELGDVSDDLLPDSDDSASLTFVAKMMAAISVVILGIVAYAIGVAGEPVGAYIFLTVIAVTHLVTAVVLYYYDQRNTEE